MELSPLPVVLLLILLVQAGLAQGRPKAVVSVSPDNHVFRGETVTLRCDIQGEGDTGWTYSWYKNNYSIYPNVTYNPYMISSVTQYDRGTYTCRGYRGRDSQSSEISNAVTLTVSERAQAVLSVSPQSWLTERDSVSLSCEVRDSSTGWIFSWYRAVPHVEVLSDSIRGAGGSYTLSPAALHQTGVYMCRAERGEPAYQTQYSNTQPLWITGDHILYHRMPILVLPVMSILFLPVLGRAVPSLKQGSPSTDAPRSLSEAS
ncbi:uncharacterized protein LOC118240594 [Electrophorus electricus]|uniref:uncharacterized protein LOC118240594 n=1 Tax=Electrophorus electricus TaxID=8005 RepID=UPI0015D02D3D|nr:uncharacterized protein LOC118240594 [Electrophorus electricus]